MSDHGLIPPERACGEDAAAYVLGALDDAEARAFHEHMQECAACREEVTALAPVLEGLPLAVPQLQPPRGLERRVISAAVHADRAGAAPRRFGRWAPRRPGEARSPSRRALVGGLATLTAAAAIALGVVLLAGGGSSEPRVVHASVTAPSASAEVRLSAGRGELVVQRMPAAPQGKVYEVWLKRSGRAPSPTDALFEVTAEGSGTVDIPGSLHGVEQVLVTPEPRGGSLVPTHPPVIVAQLAPAS